MSDIIKLRRRGDKLEEDIYKVTYQLLINEGFSSINFARVAREAKTSRSVIYRYWNTPFELVFDTVHDRYKVLNADKEKPNFDKGSLRDNLLLVGQMFINQFNSFPNEFNRMVLYEMQNYPNRIKKMLMDSRNSSLRMMDQILQKAIEKGEIHKIPVEEVKLVLFQLLRHAIILENESILAEKLETLVDLIALPAILSASK